MTHHTAHQPNRREFLATSAALAASAVPGAACLGAQQERTPQAIKLSTSSLHYRSLTLIEACHRISQLGFDAIDVWAHFEWAGPLCEHLEEGLEKLGTRRFESLLKKYDLKLFAASCYTQPVAKFAPLLGPLGGCVIVRGSHPLQGAPADTNYQALKSQMRLYIESLRPELELVEKHNCVLAIENHSGNSLLNTLDSVKLFVELNQHDRLGIALAPYHVQLNQQSVEEAIVACGDQLKFFYAWQHGNSTDQLPGIGPTDMRPWLRKLLEIDYQGYINPFMHHEPEPDDMDQALATSRDYLRKIWSEIT